MDIKDVFTVPNKTRYFWSDNVQTVNGPEVCETIRELRIAVQNREYHYNCYHKYDQYKKYYQEDPNHPNLKDYNSWFDVIIHRCEKLDSMGLNSMDYLNFFLAELEGNENV